MNAHCRALGAVARTAGAWTLVVVSVTTIATRAFQVEIPRAWDDNEVARFAVPLAQHDRSPRFLTSDQYYALKVRPIYRTYPVYAPGREPAGYMDSLKQKAPEIVFDAPQLHNDEEWIRAGEAVFHSQTVWNPVLPGDPRPQLVASLPGHVTADGVIPSANYVVRRLGVVEYGGGTSCASCHTRVMPDGSLVKGAQGNLPTQQLLARLIPSAALRDFDWRLSGAPWVMSRAEFENVSVEELTRRYRAMQPGLFERHGTAPCTRFTFPR